MGHIYAMRAAYLQQWRLSIGAYNLISIFDYIPVVAVLSWIATRSDNPAVLAYVSVGVFLMVIWNMSIFRMGWSLNNEAFQGTLELSLVSRTPIVLVMFGKALALATFSTITASVAVVALLAFSRSWVDVASVPLLLGSFAVAMFALIACGFIFAPVMVLARGRGGFFNAILPFGTVLSGFLYPISLLPGGLHTVARFLPTSWAMEALIRSTEGGASTWRIAGDWMAALAIATVYLGLTYLMFRIVEKRIRVTGALGTF